MSAVSLVVPIQPLLDVAGQSDVITLRGLQSLEHVDESLRCHRARRRKFMASGNAPDFEPATLANCKARDFFLGRNLGGLRNLRSPPPPLRRGILRPLNFAWFTEPKLAEGER